MMSFFLVVSLMMVCVLVLFSVNGFFMSMCLLVFSVSVVFVVWKGCGVLM